MTLIHTDTNTLKLAMGAGGGIHGEANVLRYLARFVFGFVVADFDGDHPVKTAQYSLLHFQVVTVPFPPL